MSDAAEQKDDVDRFVQAVRDRVARAPQLASVTRNDLERLAFMVETYKRALTTCYWLVHGSESGRKSVLREPIESTIQEAFVEAHENADRGSRTE